MTSPAADLCPFRQWARDLNLSLPTVKSLAEIKTAVFVFNAWIDAGMIPVRISVTQFQTGTGLVRQSVAEGICRALDQGLIDRQPVGNSFGYLTRLTHGAESGLSCMNDMNDHDNHDAMQQHACRSSFLPSPDELYRTLVQEFGVSARVARDIVGRHEPALVQRQIEYARSEIEGGRIRRRAAYIVARIRDDRAAPQAGPALASRPGRGLWPGAPGQPPSERWYTPEEYDLYFEHLPCSGNHDSAGGDTSGDDESAPAGHPAPENA